MTIPAAHKTQIGKAGNDTAAVEKRIEMLIRVQGNHKELLDTMESMRWKFVTAFGLGAGFSLFSIKSESGIANLEILATLLTFVISLAGLIVQIRVYSIVHSLWLRIGCLRLDEIELTKSLYGTLSGSTCEALKVPVAASRDAFSHLITVHIAVCFVFTSFIGLALMASLDTNRLLVGSATSVTILLVSWLATIWYTRSLNEGINQNDG